MAKARASPKKNAKTRKASKRTAAKPRPARRKKIAPGKPPKPAKGKAGAKRALPKKPTPRAKRPVQKKAPPAKISAPKTESAAAPAHPAMIKESAPPSLITAPPATILLPAPKMQTPAGTKASEPQMPIAPGPPPEKKEPFEHMEGTAGPLAVEINPALEKLPEWEDRGRLRRAVFEGGLKFFSLSRVSSDFPEALSLLSKSRPPATGIRGHFIICARDRSGGMAGAIDGHMLAEDIMYIDRISIRNGRRRELCILLFAAALAIKGAPYVLCTAEAPALTEGLAGKMILFGRGFGMLAIPSGHATLAVFVRRTGRELDPISSGAELARLLGCLKEFDPSFESIAAGISRKAEIALIPLPTSPDSREHLHELMDAVKMLGLKQEGIGPLIEDLKRRYVLAREDITPDAI
ncbi:MAG: hypothetical protein AB1324_01610 [Candidatus Micrarchaeota archaeon]